MAVCLGLDIGTTSVSAVAIEETGELLTSVTQAHQAALPSQTPGAAEQEVSTLRRTAQTCLRELTAQISQPIGCLGLTGQMHGFLFLNEQHQPVSPLYTWQDHRCLQPLPNRTENSLESFLSRLPEDYHQPLGCRLRAGYAVVTWEALRQTDSLPSQFSQLVDIAHFFAGELTGCQPAIDPTFAASWGVFDLATQSYAPAILQAAQLTESQLPRLLTEPILLGTVLPTQAKSWGLPAGIPVCSALGDNQASVLGSLEDPDHDLLINIGTGGQIVWCPPAESSQKPQAAQKSQSALEWRPFLSQRLLCVGAGLSGGAAYAWLVNQVKQWLAEFGLKPSDEQIHQQLERSRLNSQAESAASLSPPLRCEPFFRGTRLEPERRGLLENISEQNFSLGHLTQAVVGGIVESLADLYDQAALPVAELRRVIVAGNFFEHHRWTAQQLANRWQVPVVTPEQKEPAACGAARLAGETAGLIDTAASPVRLNYRTLCEPQW